MPRCIYCCQEKNERDFTTEHIIPNKLVNFGQGKSMTLPKLVCKYCNEYFGKTTDWELSMNSMEALMANQLGISKHKKKFFPKNLEIKMIDTRPEIKYKDIIVFPDASGQFTPYPQLKFNVDEKVICVPDYKFADEKPLLTKLVPRMPKNSHFEIIGYNSTEDVQKVEKFLKNLNPSIEIRIIDPKSKQYERIYKEVKFEVRPKITRILKRAYCKLAYNFTAYSLKEKIKMIYSPSFAPIRDFILNDEGNEQDFINLYIKPNFFMEEDNNVFNDIKYPCVFLLHWKKLSPFNSRLESQITIFNSFRYDIRLCRNFRNKIYCFSPPKTFNNRALTGKYFDPINKKEFPIYGFSKDEKTDKILIT